MRVSLRFFLAVSLLLPFQLMAEGEAGSAHLSAQVLQFDPASAHPGESVTAAGVVLGYALTDDWSIEGALAQGQSSGTPQAHAVLSSLGAVWHPWRWGAWRPQLSLEAARIGQVQDNGAAQRYNAGVLGAGLLRFAPQQRWLLRADARAYVDRRGEVDTVLGLGVGYYFPPRLRAPVDYDSDGDGTPDERDLNLAPPPPPACPVCVVPVADPCQTDRDLDGITDCRDSCPDTAPGVEVARDGCPIPQCQDGDPDADGDGVPDCRDLCPRTPAQLKVDAAGCVLMSQFPVTVSLDVKFDFDRAEIKDLLDIQLHRMKKLLLEYPELTLALQGHADAIGSEDYNLRLSEARARAVRAFLLAGGLLDSRRINVIAEGEGRPMASNDSDAGRAQNRRVAATLSIVTVQPELR